MTKRKSTKRVVRPNGRGTVMVIATLLAGSALLRLGAGAGEALAEAAVKPEMVNQVAQAQPNLHQNATNPQANRAQVGRLLGALQEREARLIEREEQIALRSKALAVADEEIERRMIALEQIESDLRKTLALADGAAENDLARLTSVYENMKPKDAAALFETMEPDFAAGFLGRMRPDAAAAVMTGLSPGAAYSISVILAGRNANAPKS